MKRFFRTLSFLVVFLIFSLNSLQLAAQKHTFVLVHGAWHGSWAWYKVQTALENGGHKVFNVNLPGHGTDTSNKALVTLDDYRDKVLGVIDGVSENVILVGHSMGGIVISQVAEARPNKIEKLVYLAAFMLRNNESLIQVSGRDSSSRIGQYLLPNSKCNVMDISRSPAALKDAFYGDANDRNIRLASLLITANPLTPLNDSVKITDENYGSVDRYYIVTKNDKTITPAAQWQMIDSLPFTTVFSIKSDHSPFLSKVRKLRNILLEIADYGLNWAPKEKTFSVVPKKKKAPVTAAIVNGKLQLETVPKDWKRVTVEFYSTIGILLQKNEVAIADMATITPPVVTNQVMIVRMKSDTGEVISKKIFTERF